MSHKYDINSTRLKKNDDNGLRWHAKKSFKRMLTWDVNGRFQMPHNTSGRLDTSEHFLEAF